MQKTIYHVSIPYYGEGEYGILIMDVDISHVLNSDDSDYSKEFEALEDAKAFIVKRYESIIENYKMLMTNIKVENNLF
tara:strand:- start:774 stop:1007 length:234 start_codon:yes stop_codon:yes gene_type:complete